MLLIKWMIGQNDQILLNSKVIIVLFSQEYENEIFVIARRSLKGVQFFGTFMSHVYSLYYLGMQPQR